MLDLLAGQCPLRRLVGEGKRQALLSLRYAFSGVDIEETYFLDKRTTAGPYLLGDPIGRDIDSDHDGQISVRRWVTRDRRVRCNLGHLGEEPLQVHFQQIGATGKLKAVSYLGVYLP